MEIYCVCVSCTYLFSMRQKKKVRREICVWRACSERRVPFLSSLLYTSQSLISDLCLQMALLNAPFSPLLNCLPLKYLYSLLQGRETGVKKEERDLDLSIKDEQHLKCIKRDDEHTCSGMARCKLNS